MIALLAALSISAAAQTCAMTGMTATPNPCAGFDFTAAIDLTVENPASDSFTLAGNGKIYGSWPYTSLPVTVGPLLGDNESAYSFVAWDKHHAECQTFVTLPAANCGPICEFSHPSLDLVTCISNALAIVVFDVDYVNMPGVAFNLLDENGAPIGSYAYSSLPVTISNFKVNGAAPITLTICDQTNEDCCNTFTLDAIDCNPTNCELFSAVIDPECTGNNFLVHIDFAHTNSASDSFTVNGNNLAYGTFAYADLPITLGPLNGNTGNDWEFVVRDADDPACQLVSILGPYMCPPPCDVLDLVADPQLCSGDTAYALAVSVDIEGEGDHGLSLLSPTRYYGSYPYATLPVTLNAYEGSGTFYDFITVCDNDNPGCCATTTFEALLCAGCLIYNLEATPQPCNAEDEFFVQIDFDYNNVSQEGFSITGNGNAYGTFLYEWLPVLVGPFPGDSAQFLEFVVTDLVNAFCFNAVELGVVSCDDICNLTNPVVEPLTCSGTETFSAVLDFDYQGTGSAGFTLWTNGNFYGNFDYSALPLTISDFPSNGNVPDTVVVCDQMSPACCASVVFEGLSCACEIIELAYEPITCMSDTTFAIELEIYAENASSNFADVFFDGQFLGFFSFETLPVFIPNIPEGDGEGLLKVCVNDQPTCCAEIIVNEMLCDGPECYVSNLLAETGACTSDSTYLLDIVFDVYNFPTDSVDIFANGLVIGTYKVDPEFIRIEHFPSLQSDTVILSVCAHGAADCCDSYTYLAPDCTNFHPCSIDNLFVDLGPCATDSTYRLDILFDYANLPGDFVVITGNGEEIGTRLVNDGHIIFDDFPELPGAVVALTVCALGDPSCCAVVTFAEPACVGQNFCHVWNLVAEAGECLTDSTFILYLDFDVENLPGGEVVIASGGMPVDTLVPSGGPYVIEHFEDVNGPQILLTVCALGGSGCCDSFTLPSPDCDGSEACHLLDLVGLPGDCTSDSTFNLFISYQSINFPGDSISVTANDTHLGNFLHQPTGFTIEHVPAFQTQFTELQICATEAEDCCASAVFETPDCGQSMPCSLYDLLAEVGECTSDTTFLLDFIFETNNPPGDSILVFANGVFVGAYAISPTFNRIEHFPLLPGEQTTLTVCALGAPDCCDTVGFENPSCGGDCEIFDITADPVECTSDSTFSAIVNFDWVNINADGFDLYASDQYLGFFASNALPAEISDFPANENGIYEVTVCESDNTECCASLVFAGPLCGGAPCSIFDLAYVTTECNAENQFFFILDFSFANVGNQGFSVLGNGINYGSFPYTNVPLELGPFEANGTAYEFVVRDNQYPDCQDVIAPGMIDCATSVGEPSAIEIFSVYNNGAMPWIDALQEISVSLCRTDGKMLVSRQPVLAGSQFNTEAWPDGMYIAVIHYGDTQWPIRLVRISR